MAARDPMEADSPGAEKRDGHGAHEAHDARDVLDAHDVHDAHDAHDAHTAHDAQPTGIDHAVLTTRLMELRARLIRVVLFLLVASVAVYVVAPWLLNDMIRHLPGAGELVFLSPAEAFVSRIKLAVAGGAVLSVPYLMLQVVRFFSPMMSRRDRRTAYWLIPVSMFLFTAGVAFGYSVLLRFALTFLLGFGGPDLVPMLTLASYIRFVMWLVVPLGLIFQLPIVITFFTRLGIIDPRAMARRRKYAVLAIFVVAAILTPADVFSQFLMAVPLLILYEISLLIARIAKRQRTA